MNRKTKPKANSDNEPSFRVKGGFSFSKVKTRFNEWLKEQVPLMEAFWVAVTFHVLLFPLIWFMGWALPWPKSPMITTVIEINLENWPNEAVPEKIEEIYNMKRSQALQDK